MEIKEVVLSRTFNCGNYESLRVELKADVQKGEELQKVLAFLDEQTKDYYRSKM
jgi:hypothetical protein